MVAIHVVAEEIVEVRLGPLASKHIQVAVPLRGQENNKMWDVNQEARTGESKCRPGAERTHGVEEHAVSDAGLHVLGAGVARVFPQEAPRPGLAVVGVQAAELGLRRPAVLHTAVAREDAAAKRVDHVLLRVHAHLAKTHRDTRYRAVAQYVLYRLHKAGRPFIAVALIHFIDFFCFASNI